MLLSNPTPDSLRETVASVLHVLQVAVRSRKVDPPRNFDEVFDKPQGILRWHGGQPDKQDGGYSTGQTSRLGIVWWTDRNNNLHVRVEADRTQASNFSVPDIFSSAQEPFNLVFPNHDPTYCVKCGYQIPCGQGHWNGNDNFVCDTCIQEDRYFVETGFLPQGRRKKLK